MEPLLSEQQSLLRDSAIKLAAAQGGPKRARKLRDAGIEIDREAWRAVVEAGWLSTLVGEQHAGMGLGALDLALAIEETGKQLLMVPLVEAAAVAWAISQASAGLQAPPILVEAMGGSKLVVPATSAPEWSFAARIPVRDDPGSSATTIDSKGHVPSAGAADAILLDTAIGTERILCVLPRSELDIDTSRNVDGSTSSRVSIGKSPISPDAVLHRGEPASKLATRLQELLVLLTSAELLGVAQAALDTTNDYLKLRKQFGKPIGSFQGLQHRMVDCFVDLELSRSLLYRILAAWNDGTCHPAMISACKARLSRGALVTVRASLQLHGAIGYTDEHDIGLYYKRAVSLASRYGNEIMHVDAFSVRTLATTGAQG